MTAMTPSPKTISRAYHDHWRAGRVEEAAALLASDVRIDTPINSYPCKADFVTALAGFASLVTMTDNLVDLADGEDVVQIYDMDVAGLGVIRIAEHFTVRHGMITQIRQIHDTAALRTAGFEQ